MKRNKIVLLGAGLANLEILYGLQSKDTSENDFILISPERTVIYSGMIPRFLMGNVSQSELEIDVGKFAARKSVQLIVDHAIKVDINKKILELFRGDIISFDTVVINIGGTAFHLPTNSAEKTIYLKPFSPFLKKWDHINREISSGRQLKFVVIGGGAAAVETAAALKGTVEIVTAGNRLCENYSPQISARILKSLMAQGIRVRFNERIERIGNQLEFDYVFVSSPVRPSNLEISPKPQTDLNGFLLVDEELKIADSIYAAGDGSAIRGFAELPKSGVIAVHQGRYLLQRIRHGVDKFSVDKFTPPKWTLNILIEGKGLARVVYGPFSLSGKLAYKLKNIIDRKYVKKFS